MANGYYGIDVRLVSEKWFVLVAKLLSYILQISQLLFFVFCE